ncbi:NIF3 protein 1 [Fasciolopsis buskii]|uniref:NIF3-like protein 1 n=1 Tax=Fasciolopsis buskii TaxID=27845 RepID=A0A8E0S6A2_9TREM|nr:NIF3 protein 1 [Fasciolopsis buski]
MDLRQVVRILNHFCVPHLADTWDNVGLLVQPSAPFAVSRILVTNDLTEPVLSEALKLETNLILSYHPPVFSPLKRITTDCHWKERLVVTCLENRIAVYSPHTGLDAKVNGVNDWLLSPFDLVSKKPITPIPYAKESMTRLTFPFTDSAGQFCITHPSSVSAARLPGRDGSTVSITCSTANMTTVMKQAMDMGFSAMETETVQAVIVVYLLIPEDGQ